MADILLKVQPIDKGYTVTSPFGGRIHPISHVYTGHSGIDLAYGNGKQSAVYAVADGNVIVSGQYGGYGNTVIIDHGGWGSLYGHLASTNVAHSTKILAGQKIGVMGTSGNSTGIHLHFEIHIGDCSSVGRYAGLKPVDPRPYLDGKSFTTGSYDVGGETVILPSGPVVGARTVDVTDQPAMAYANIYIGNKILSSKPPKPNILQSFEFDRLNDAGSRLTFTIFDDSWDDIEQSLAEHWDDIQIEYGYVGRDPSKRYRLLLQNYSVSFCYTGVILTISAISQGQYDNLNTINIDLGGGGTGDIADTNFKPFCRSGLTTRQIATLLKDKPMSACAPQIKAIENKYKVHALYALAVAQQESGSGSSEYAQKYKNPYSLGGQKPQTFASFNDSVIAFGELMNDNMYKNKSLTAISRKYCPPGDSWAQAVANIYAELCAKCDKLGYRYHTKYYDPPKPLSRALVSIPESRGRRTEDTKDIASRNPTEAVKAICDYMHWIVKPENFDPSQDIPKDAESFTVAEEYPAKYIQEVIVPAAASASDSEEIFQFYLDEGNVAYFKRISYGNDGTSMNVAATNVKTYIYQKGYDSAVKDLTFDIKGVFGGTTNFGVATGYKCSAFDTKSKSKVTYNGDTKSTATRTTGKKSHTKSTQSKPLRDAAGNSPTIMSNKLYYQIKNSTPYEATLVVTGDPTISIFDYVRIINITDAGYLHHTSGVYRILGIIDRLDAGQLITTLKLMRNGDIEQGIEIINPKSVVK